MPAPASAVRSAATSFPCRPGASSRRWRRPTPSWSAPRLQGAYTGLFKHLFDLVSPEALAGKPVALAATGGGARHALVVEHALRPLFGFFTALTVPTAVYASDPDFRDGGLDSAAIRQRVAEAGSQLAGLAGARAAQAPAPLARLAGGAR